MKKVKVVAKENLQKKIPMVDIEVQSDDRLFLITDSKIVTHNSGNIGAVQHFATGALALSLAGKLVIKPQDEDTNIYSIAVSMNPFASTNDPARILMSASQQRHAIPLKNAHRPYILSGYESLPAILSSSSFAIKAKKPGVIKYVDNETLVIQYNDGTIESYSLRPSGSGDVDIAIEYDILVEESDRVEAGQLLVKHKYFFDNQGVYRNGIRFYCVILPYKGFNFEDGLIISESAAKKLGVSVHIKQQDIEISEQEDIVNFVYELGHISKGHILVTTKPKHAWLTSDQYEVNPDVLMFSGYKTYPVKYDADILDIQIYAPSEEFVEKNFPNLLPYIKQQIKEANEKLTKYEELGIEADQITKLKANPYGVSYKGAPLKDSIIIRYVYRYENPVKLGDKFANLHGNKGVISAILPDDLMPRDPNGKPFEMIVNPLGIPSRKNPGQLLELYLSRAAHYITESLKQAVKHASYDEAVKILIEFYDVLYERKPKIKNQLVTQIKNMNAKEKQSLVDDFIVDGVVIYSPPVNGLDIDDVKRVYDHYGWKMEDYVYLPEYGPNVKSARPVPYGYQYWLKLRQLSETKMSARSYGKGYQSKTLQPVGEKGAKAQREGELDTWALLAWGAKDLLKEFMTIHADDISSKFQAVREIAYKGSVSLQDLQFTKPVTSRMLKAIIAGMMITDDLNV